MALGIQEERFKKNLRYCFLLLKYRSRSRAEIISRLKRRKVSLSEIKKITDYLEENNYINDREFTRLFIATCLEKGWGPKRIEFTLKRLGIGEELRREVFKDKERYIVRLRELLENRIFRYQREKNSSQKILRYMLSRGFEYEDIIRQMQEMEIKF